MNKIDKIFCKIAHMKLSGKNDIGKEDIQKVLK
jgi:hypothetical protein